MLFIPLIINIMDRKFRIELYQFQQNTSLASNCNNITFINNGAATIQINNFNLIAGSSLAIGGNENELDTTVYQLNFNGNTNGNVAVIKKIFV
jgi:hypothetical protein